MIKQLFLGSFGLAWTLGQSDSFKSQVSDVNPPAIYKIDPNSGSIKCRVEFLRGSFDQFLKSPVFGSGLNTNSSHLSNFAFDNPSSRANCQPNTTHPHNATALIAGELGLLGLILILTPLAIWILLNLNRNLVAGMSISFPILLHSQTEFPLNVSMTHWLWLVLIFTTFTSSIKGAALMNHYVSKVIGIASFVLVIMVTDLLITSHLVGINLYQIQNLPPKMRLEELIKSPYRNNKFFQWRYDQLIGKDALELALALDDRELGKQFLPTFKRGVSGAAMTNDTLLIRKIESLITK